MDTPSIKGYLYLLFKGSNRGMFAGNICGLAQQLAFGFLGTALSESMFQSSALFFACNRTRLSWAGRFGFLRFATT